MIPNYAVAKYDVDRLGRTGLFPAQARHADVRTVHEHKPIPGRRFPKEMKTIRGTARQFRALTLDVFGPCRMQLIPDFARKMSGLIRIIDPRDKKRGGLRLIPRFETCVNSPSADDAGEKTQREQTK